MALAPSSLRASNYASLGSRNRCRPFTSARPCRQVCFVANAAPEVNKVPAELLAQKPDLKRPEAPPPKKLFGNGPDAPAAAAAAMAAPVPMADSSPTRITVEYQRQRAREMIAYFKDQKRQDTIVKAQTFGWTPSNEIGNGRWVMFGFFVGMLTEYATGVDFIDQLKLLVSYLGIVDTD